MHAQASESPHDRTSAAAFHALDATLEAGAPRALASEVTILLRRTSKPLPTESAQEITLSLFR